MRASMWCIPRAQLTDTLRRSFVAPAGPSGSYFSLSPKQEDFYFCFFAEAGRYLDDSLQGSDESVIDSADVQFRTVGSKHAPAAVVSIRCWVLLRAQESVNVEVRSKAIPLPKPKAAPGTEVKPKAKVKAKAKAKAAADAASPKAAPKAAPEQKGKR